MASPQESKDTQENERPLRKYSLKEGYDINFTQQPPEEIQLDCSICLQVLSDPCILDCKCGYSFCRECIQPIQNKGSTCPLCTMKFSLLLPNIRLDKTIREFRSNCSNDTLGCTWTGELRLLRKHLNTPAQAKNRYEGCEYASIECFLCSFECKRRELANHERKQCPERQYTCEYCQEFTATFKEVYTKHWPKCTQLKTVFETGAGISMSTSQYTPLTAELHTGSSVDRLGHLEYHPDSSVCEGKYHPDSSVCEGRYNPDSSACEGRYHPDSSVCEGRYTAQCHANDEDSIAQLPKLLPKPPQNERKAIFGQPQQLIMNISELNPENVWYSPPFSSHELGYTLCLSVQHCRAYLSVSTHILRGEHDKELQWPLEGKVNIKLVSSDPERSHCRVIEYTNQVGEEYAGRIKAQDQRSKGLGREHFIARRSLAPNFLTLGDSLCFEVQCTFYTL